MAGSRRGGPAVDIWSGSSAMHGYELERWVAVQRLVGQFIHPDCYKLLKESDIYINIYIYILIT